MTKESLIDQYPFCESFFWDASISKLNSPEFSSFSKIAAIRIQDRKNWYFTLQSADKSASIKEEIDAVDLAESAVEPTIENTISAEAILDLKDVEVKTIEAEVQNPKEEVENPIEEDNTLELESLEKEYLAQNYSIEHLLSAESPSAPEKETMNQPVISSSTSKQSFTAWMNEIAIADSNPKLKKQSVVEKFLAQEGSTLKKPNFFSATTLAKASLEEHEDFITPTLAAIYEKQGNYSKATEAYKKLALKFPEKSSYFAALILKIEQKQKKK